MNTSIKPGQIMLDTEGKRVQAHGGSIYYDKKTQTFYFYGENKEFTTKDTKIWTYGVRAYSSKDFYNWKDEGLIIKPNLEDENSSLHPENAMLDRPHIIYNKKNDNFVCWCKIMHKNGIQSEVVLTSKNFLGPYENVNDNIRPFGFSAGDFDLYVDEETDKAYYLFEKVHTETIIAELNDDYTDVTDKYSSHFPHPYPPYVREATAHVLHNGRHFIITSGTTGYLPNPSEVAVSDSIHGPYKVLGNLCPNDDSDTTFHSQVSTVFKFPGKKNLYIAIADRWCPQSMDLPYPFYRDIFEGLFSGKMKREDMQKISLELAKKYNVPLSVLPQMMDTDHTKEANYVWLPLEIIEPCEKYPDGMILMDFKNEWRVEDFE